MLLRCGRHIMVRFFFFISVLRLRLFRFHPLLYFFQFGKLQLDEARVITSLQFTPTDRNKMWHFYVALLPFCTGLLRDSCFKRS